MEEKIEPIHLMMTIVERGRGEAMAKLFQRQHVIWHYQSSGFGTASSEVLDVLGFGTKERDILFSLAPANVVRQLMFQLNNDLRSELRAKGITVHLPLSSINKSVLDFLNHMDVKQEVEERTDVIAMAQGVGQSLILVVVNQGHTDAVMETANAAGARGGTIIRSRWLGAQESEKLYGIALQDEKEIIAIVATSQTRNHIMESIQKKHGIHTEVGAMICSLGLEGMTRLS